jgi:glucose-6-phosphate 1-epimerase
MSSEVEATRLRPDGDVEITLTLDPNDATRALGYSAFQLSLRLTVRSELQMELEVRNDSSSPLLFEEALHTCLAIGDIHQTRVFGLEGTLYIDKTDGFQRKLLDHAPLRIGKETDQVHLNTKSACVVHDPVWNRRITVEKSGSQSTVVWNPWIDKANATSDMAPGDWQRMICVESANAADNAVPLGGGDTQKMTATIRVG